MNKITVELGNNSYPIYIGQGLINDPSLWQSHVAGNSFMLVSNTKIAPLYSSAILSNADNYKHDICRIEDGEQYKTLDTFENIISALVAARFDRNTTLVALGGGVVGDICGFAAAAFQRGINFIQVPTTLLAMVDSSVGGKTAVNHALGKNMIGAFHQPQCVIIDIDTLATLEEREFKAGLAEVIKYGLIVDAEFFSWLEKNIDALLARDPEALIYAIQRSCEIKAQVVSQDEKEQGIRAILNLGHTFGHAIEAGLGYGEWLHGEAISTGMLLASALSRNLGWIDDDTFKRTKSLLVAAGLPVHIPKRMSTEKFLAGMAVDKKVKDGVLRLILLKELGNAVIADSIESDDIVAVLEAEL